MNKSNDGPQIGPVVTDFDGSAHSTHAHRLVRETAIAMTMELYDTMMQDNEWYRQWKALNPGANSKKLAMRFLQKNISKVIPQARAQMTKMLTMNYDEKTKTEIYEALLLDSSLKRGRGN